MASVTASTTRSGPALNRAVAVSRRAPRAATSLHGATDWERSVHRDACTPSGTPTRRQASSIRPASHGPAKA